MRIIHVVPRIDREASGLAQSVSALCSGLATVGDDVTLVSLEPAAAAITGVTQRTFPPWRFPARLGVAPAMRRGLTGLAGTADVVHSHSLWRMPAVYPGTAVRQTAAKLVVSPHGTLSPQALRFSPRLKQAFWTLLQERVLKTAACIHATGDHEYRHIRDRGLMRQPVAIIPYGVEIPPQAASRNPTGPLRTLLYLGRLHPIKGVDVLLKAWRAVQERFPQWQLDIVGPAGGDYGRTLRALAAGLGVARARFRGPLYGAAKLAAYQQAELFVLPSHSENFGMTVAEALAAGTPAIVTHAAPWAGLNQKGAGWQIEDGLDALVDVLCEACDESSPSLAARGMRGRDWMAAEFSWNCVVDRMRRTYAWICSGGSQPPWVRVD